MQPIIRWTTCLAVVALSLMAVACASSDTNSLSGASVQQEAGATSADQAGTQAESQGGGAEQGINGPRPTIRIPLPTVRPPMWTPTPEPTMTLVAPLGTCCQSLTFTAGNWDDFATSDGAEPAAPSAGLVKRLAALGQTPKGFDDPATDKYFAHTFRLPRGGCIADATLYVRARPESVVPPGGDASAADSPDGGSTSDNDALWLTVTDAAGNWNAADEAIAYFGSGNPSPGLWSVPWIPPVPGSPWRNFSFLNPPAAVTGPGAANLVASLQNRRMVDVVVQDDTNIDVLELSVQFCDCPPNPAPTPGSGRGTGFGADSPGGDTAATTEGGENE